MPTFEREDASIYYEEYGSGYPLLLFAPGGMRSAIEFWHNAPFDPTVALAANFRVIAMDQRNAGRSRAPLHAWDGWDTYTADHVGLLDHLGIEQAHVMGGCIGSSYCLGMIQAIPNRITAAVLQNPIGLTPANRVEWWNMFDVWLEQVKTWDPNVSEPAATAIMDRMWGGDFVFNVSREFVRSVKTPMLVLAGNDNFHPAPISQEIRSLVPSAAYLEDWKEPEVVAETVRRVREFLESHTPARV